MLYNRLKSIIDLLYVWLFMYVKNWNRLVPAPNTDICSNVFLLLFIYMIVYNNMYYVHYTMYNVQLYRYVLRTCNCVRVWDCDLSDFELKLRFFPKSYRNELNRSKRIESNQCVFYVLHPHLHVPFNWGWFKFLLQLCIIHSCLIIASHSLNTNAEQREEEKCW